METKELIGDIYKLQESKINEAITSLEISDVTPLITTGIIVTKIFNYTLNDGNIVLYKCLYPNSHNCLSEIFIPRCKFDELFTKQV